MEEELERPTRESQKEDTLGRVVLANGLAKNKLKKYK